MNERKRIIRYVDESVLDVINEILSRGNDVKIRKSREEVVVLEITATRKHKIEIKDVITTGL